MALASLKSRIERLEAKHKVDDEKVVGAIGGLPETYVEEIDGVLYLRRPATPTGEPFADFALKQQSELLALLRELGDAEDPQNAAPDIVSTIHIAPLPNGKKRPRYFEIHGREIDAFNITRN